MKNASAKNTVAVLYVAVMALALSVGAFAGTAHAQLGTDNGGYGGFGSPDIYDYTFTPDTPNVYDYTFTPDTPNVYDYTFTPDQNPVYDYTFTPDTYAPSYSTPTTYSTYGSSYGTASYYTAASAPVYSAMAYIPASAQPAVNYALRSSPVYYPQPNVPQRPNTPQPTYAASAPINNTNTNTIPNTNTNVNTPTFTATYTPTNTSTNVNTQTAAPVYAVSSNTNTNTPVATVSNSGNSSASTGAITNTFAPVINVGSTGPQRPVVATFPRPYCTITSSNYGNYNNYNYNNYNQPMTLTWSSTNATSAYISPNVGNVNTNGSTTVYPNGYTTYTLTVTGPGGSDTCQTAANYANYATPSYTYNTPAPVYTATPAPYVSLSQIPYTGFDYGPVGNAIYWTAIVSFAVAAGYLLVYGFPKMALAGAFAGRVNSFDGSDELKKVFKSSIVTSTDVAPNAEEPSVNEFALPVATSSHGGVTSDAMIIDRSASGTPRIVIARS